MSALYCLYVYYVVGCDALDKSSSCNLPPPPSHSLPSDCLLADPLFFYAKKPPRIQRKVNDILRRMAEIGNLPYLDWGDLKVLLAAKMLEVVGAFEKESGFVRAKGGKDYVQQR